MFSKWDAVNGTDTAEVDASVRYLQTSPVTCEVQTKTAGTPEVHTPLSDNSKKTKSVSSRGKKRPRESYATTKSKGFFLDSTQQEQYLADLGTDEACLPLTKK